MKRPHSKTLWNLAVALLVLSVMDIVLTTIGILFFYGKEGNPFFDRPGHMIAPDILVRWRKVVGLHSPTN